MDLGILEWLNEHELTDYPLTAFSGFPGFLLDANFVQFDGFVPTLISLVGTDGFVTLNIQFDRELVAVVLDASTFADGRGVRIYGANNRYLGALVFGERTTELFASLLGKTIVLNIPFAASTVVSINSGCGVFTVEGLFGDIAVTTGSTVLEREIFFGVSGNNVTWNAVGLAQIADDAVTALKTLNGVHPTHNAVYILESDVVKVAPGSGGLVFSLANSLLNANIAPLLKYGG